MKKRLFLIISILAVAFTLAGCSSNDKKVAFDYDNDTIAAYANTLANGYIKLSEDEAVVENWEANGTDAVYISGQGQQVSISQSDVDAVKVFSSMEKDYGKFESLDSTYEIEEVKDTVIVILQDLTIYASSIRWTQTALLHRAYIHISHQNSRQAKFRLSARR